VVTVAWLIFCTVQSPNGRQPGNTGDLLGLSATDSPAKSAKGFGVLIDMGGAPQSLDLLGGGVPEDTYTKYVAVIIHEYCCSIMSYYVQTGGMN